MKTDISEAINQLKQERGLSEELILQTIEDTLVAAYKRRYGNVDNAVVRFAPDNSSVEIFSRKKVVDGVYDPAIELDVEDAKNLFPDAELGDELLIEVDPKDFDRGAVQTAKQTAHQSLRDIQKDTLYAEYKGKEGEIIIGYFLRERNGTIYVDLGKVEGVLPKKFQSPREVYHQGDRIKAIIVEVNKASAGLQVVLSRSHTDFVKTVFELEVPEISDRVVEIFKIVREAGHRTKIAVFSSRDDVDPVGACVGLKGMRIQTIIKELEGEKIDILKYDPDPERFIKNALSPAEIKDVVLIDKDKRQALAVVADTQLSLAIGKQGLNVRLANRLTDWNIDVKTEEQFAEMDISIGTRRAVSELFGEEEFTRIDELPETDARVIEILANSGIEFIEDFLELTEEECSAIEGLQAEDIESLRAIIEENVEIIEEDYSADASEDASADVFDEDLSPNGAPDGEPVDDGTESTEPSIKEEYEDEEFECPECGATITIDMTNCPSCGIGLSFEYEDEE